MSELEVEVCGGHFTKRHRSHTCTHVNCGHCFSNIASKPRHVRRRPIVIYSLIDTSLALQENVVRDTSITSVIGCAVDAVLETLLALVDERGLVCGGKEVHRAGFNALDFV